MSVEQEIRAAVLKAAMLAEQHRELSALSNPTAADRAALEEVDDSLRFKYDLNSGKAWLNGFVAGPTAESARRMLLAFARHGKNKSIELSINSWGGIAYDGIAIYNMLRESEIPVNTRAIGMAYSAASLIFEAGDTRTIATGAALGIHKAWSMWIGNSDDMLATAERLERTDARIMEIYTARAGKEKAEAIAEAVQKNTALSAAEAVSLGLADAVSKDDEKLAPRPGKPAAGKEGIRAMNEEAANAAEVAEQPQAEEAAETPKPQHKHHLAELGGLCRF